MYQKFVNIITSDKGKVVSTRINHSWFIKNNHEDLWNWFLEATSSFQDLTIHQRAKLVVTDQFRSRPGCENCGKPVQFIGLELSHCCSRECEKKVPKREKKHKPVSTGKKYKETGKRAETIKQKTLEKSGFETYEQLVDELKNRLSQNHSFRMISDDLNIGRDAILRIIEEYGIVVETDRSEVIKNGVHDLYGVDNVMNVEGIRERHNEVVSKVFAERGVLIAKKTRQTLKERTGFEHALQNPESWEKYRFTNLERYGVDHYHKVEGVAKAIYQKVVSENGGVHPYQAATSKRSKGESELVEWLLSLGIEETRIDLNKRTLLGESGLEVDVFLKEVMVGIEYCGVYYHSESGVLHSFRQKFGRNPNEDEMKTIKETAKVRHSTKSKLSCESGIELVTLWCHEWKHSRETIENWLKSKVKPKPIYDWKIDEIDQNDELSFRNRNNTLCEQTKFMSQVSFGISVSDELVGTIGITETMTNVWSIDHITVSGGFDTTQMISKLMDHVVDILGPGKVYRYEMNERFPIRKELRGYGFSECYTLEPNSYLFTNKSPRPLLESEVSLEYDTKYHRIWDCGSSVFELQK